MTIPQVTTAEIRINQLSRVNNTIICEVYLNDKYFCAGIQNANYPMPFGRYRAVIYKGKHPHERILLENVPEHAGVEIHEANVASQLKGCTAVGVKVNIEFLENSVWSLNALVSHLKLYNVIYVSLSHSANFQPA
jgi:hypothetical protein